MKRIFFALALVTLSLASVAQEWQRLSAPVMTPWGEQLDPEHVWQEYPRPQLVRPDWMNLNGVWSYFRRDNAVRLTAEPVVSRFNKSILVPFGVESALSGIMHSDLGTTANSTLMYRRTFTLTDAFKNRRVLLHFGAVDWRCAVYVNRTKVAEHDGGNDPFTVDITQALLPEGEQELQVAVYDPSSRGGQPRGKQTTNPGGIWYVSCSGIWQTVWLEPVNENYVERYEVVPDAASGTVRVRVIANNPTCKYQLIARDGEDIVATSERVPAGEEVTLVIPDAKLWSPDSPFLYNLDIVLCNTDCQECDRARGYFGLRTLTTAMIDGHPAFLLNGKPLFMYGPLDQGWWPDGLLTPPSYEAMIYDLQTIKSLGMNMVRKHIKVEPDLWYEWCDRNGLIVWQDMPNGSESGNLGSKDELQHIFYSESERIVTALKQHPCICVWVPYNEGWGQDAGAGAGHTMRGYLVVRNADADHGRLMNAASGWTDFQIGDITDAHSYPSPNGTSNPGNNRVNVCGEFGGITYLIDGHLWAGSQQVYTSVDNSQDYTERFNQYTSALQSLQLEKGLWAAVYTQITDVEQEVNGILTYDRKVLKVDADQLASIRKNVEQTINSRLSGATSVVAAADNATNVYWRYTTDEPATGWEQPDFDDSAWKRGMAGFGDISQPAARVHTKWSTPEIWIRRSFTLDGISAADLPRLCLRLFYDEDSEVYINGVLAFSITGYNTTYQLFDISEAARRTLNLDGENVIAIHTLQTSGGQYIDAGFSLRSYTPNSELTPQPMAMLNRPAPAEDPAHAYLLCYSKTTDDKLYYASSLDGQTWQSVNDGKPVFGHADGQPAVVRPFIRRLEDESGTPTFHLVFGGSADAPGLYHFISKDLVTWTTVGPGGGQVNTSPVEGPEVELDATTGYYFYYWTARSGSTYVPQWIRTNNFQNFTRPTSFFTPGSSVRDLHVFKTDQQYIALYTDPDNQGLCMAQSATINPSRGKFRDFKRVFPNSRKLFTPATFPSFDGKGWLLFGAEDGNLEFYCAATAAAADLTWLFSDYAVSGFPSDANGGKVLVVSRDELQRITDTIVGIGNLRAANPHEGRAPGVYTLAGQRVGNSVSKGMSTSLPKGVYITGGRKVLVK
ncbi:MAG: glycoside hydrolase family 2 [Bacteroidaceae bacterium]|nr:glycoside hydrolase family 2 [Bacteroidaceae bacterium]